MEIALLIIGKIMDLCFLVSVGTLFIVNTLTRYFQTRDLIMTPTASLQAPFLGMTMCLMGVLSSQPLPPITVGAQAHPRKTMNWKL